MTRTVWLVSYPKSGNTWFRLFIANLLHPQRAPVDINDLPLAAPIASSRQHFNRELGVPSALLTQAEIDRWRPVADTELARTWPHEPLLRKAHDAYHRLPDGAPMMGAGPAFAAIYFLRRPWDIAPSLANHMGCTLDRAVEHMCDPAFALDRSRNGLSNQLRQPLGSWAEHAAGWLAAPLALHLMRYEEMRAEPLAAFTGAVRFLGLHHDRAAITAALDACRFERLQAQEANAPFREAPREAPRFFRSGRVGEGLASLDPAQLARLRAMDEAVDAAVALRTAA